MKPALLYLTGPPGTGKSALMAALTADCERSPSKNGLPHDHLSRRGAVVAAEAGHWRPGFPGTDTLALNAHPQAVAWIANAHHALVLAEGDRLATIGFLQAARHAGYTCHLASLTAPNAVLDARCTARGSAQNPAWRRGRATKTERLTAHAEAAGHHVIHLDATQPTRRLARLLHSAVPALAALGGPGSD
jgi:P-loop Nucleotide Kinase3